jgi:hypothetical protein
MGELRATIAKVARSQAPVYISRRIRASARNWWRA